jgi:hypothetical protein
MLALAQADSFTRSMTPLIPADSAAATAIAQTWHGRISTDHQPSARTHLEDIAGAAPGFP